MTLRLVKKATDKDYVCVVCGSPHIHNKTNQWCKKCYDHDYNTNRRDKNAERLRQAWIREKEFERYVLARTKHKAKKEGKTFNLDLAWIKQELAKGKCSVTNMPLVKPTYRPGKRGSQGAWSPSIDRIDNSKGYTKSNCRIVVWMYNLAKNNYGDRDIVKMSIALATTFMLKMHDKETNPAFASYLQGMQAAMIS